MCGKRGGKLIPEFNKIGVKVHVEDLIFKIYDERQILLHIGG